MDSLYLDGGTVLEVNRPYLVPLMEEMNLPPDLRARTNPRSSTVGLDIFTRIVTDHSHRFDDIAAGYRDPLHLEVVPRSFAVRMQRGNPRLTGEEMFRRAPSTRWRTGWTPGRPSTPSSAGSSTTTW